MKRLSVSGIYSCRGNYHIIFNSRPIRLHNDYIRRINKYRKRVGQALIPQLDQLESVPYENLSNPVKIRFRKSDG